MDEFRGKRGGVVVFGVSGPDAEIEALRCAIQYAADGAILIECKVDKKWQYHSAIGDKDKDGLYPIASAKGVLGRMRL